ncbi:Multidrug/pheromone exporter, MDR family, ABC transporter family [Gossypium australe]|uniref:Multidrug/pheromone exporter, MDR family, ABC transporter family n=1 Tax=Gossypium australe TaxID=47621 RepID=A0A5B6X2Q6_9ROSI|nr:Multidrug/pheromone exporter, MDR family, ABC transporter family [Gossypium australe]
MAFATFPAGVLETGCWMYASERQMARLRLAFLKAMLGQEIGAFDTEITSGKTISATRCIRREVSLLTLVVAPKILVTGATYTKKMSVISATKTVYISEATSMVEQARIIWIGAIVVTSRKAKGSDVIAAVMSILFSSVSLTFAAPDIQIFNQEKVVGYEVFKVIQRKSAISYGSKGKKKVKKIDGNIEIQDVYFAYPSRPEKSILEGFSLSIPIGKMVALVGCSGCGKSTAISLVERFYDPYKGSAMFFMQMPEVFIMCLHIIGEILIDNYNIKDLDLKFLRKNIGVVSQEPSLFAGTIKDNIKVGNMDASDQQVWDAAIMANAHTFVTQLPNQYSTEVIHLAPIFTILQMSTIINADIITVVENGQVTETGTHRSLLDSSKFYKNLFNIQNIEQIRKRELAKIAIGSIAAAAFASVSKHVFEFFIITIRLAYYNKDAKQLVRRMALVAWAVLPCHIIGGLIQAKSAKGFAGDSVATYREVVALASKSAANIRTIASFFHEEHILEKARMSLEEPMKRNRKEYGIRSYQIFSFTVPSITELWMLIPAGISAINVLTPAFKILDRKTKIEPDAPQDTQLKMIKGKIEFQKVEFNYPLRTEATVLNSFSLQIEPGTKVALIGPSGAGKSSVLATLLRTLLKRPAILLLDEATSALDAKSERTVIIVAHRLSTVVNSNVIVMIDKGEIVESGSYSTLISTSDGVYSRLFQIQNEI